jgi:hypothetical protein
MGAWSLNVASNVRINLRLSFDPLVSDISPPYPIFPVLAAAAHTALEDMNQQPGYLWFVE